jgi:hypothetical protein
LHPQLQPQLQGVQVPVAHSVHLHFSQHFFGVVEAEEDIGYSFCPECTPVAVPVNRYSGEVRLFLGTALFADAAIAASVALGAQVIGAGVAGAVDAQGF